MKKFLKIAGIILGVIVLLIAIAGFTISIKGIPSYEVNAPDLKVKVDSASIARGTKLAAMVCMACHMDLESRKLEGLKMRDLDRSFGEAWAPNITQHATKGVGRYTDGELAFLLRTGIKKNGQYSPPWMPKFPNMAESEIHDIIAFMRSDHPSLEASETVQPASKPSFLTKMLTNVAFKPFAYPEKVIKKPSITEPIVYGEYLANAVYHCYGCHSADFKTNDGLNPENSVGLFGGGNPLLDLEGNIVLSTNITMDKETGIGNWTEDQFVESVKYGKRPDGTVIMYPMGKFSLLDDEEVKAIWAYLKTVPPMVNEVLN